MDVGSENRKRRGHHGRREREARFGDQGSRRRFRVPVRGKKQCSASLHEGQAQGQREHVFGYEVQSGPNRNSQAARENQEKEDSWRGGSGGVYLCGTESAGGV